MYSMIRRWILCWKRWWKPADFTYVSNLKFSAWLWFIRTFFCTPLFPGPVRIWLMNSVSTGSESDTQTWFHEVVSAFAFIFCLNLLETISKEAPNEASPSLLLIITLETNQNCLWHGNSGLKNLCYTLYHLWGPYIKDVPKIFGIFNPLAPSPLWEFWTNP